MNTIDLDALRGLTFGKVGITDTACLLCGPCCKTPVNRTRKVLRVWDDGEFVTYKCARCEASGWAKGNTFNGQRSTPRPKLVPVADKSGTALFLWKQSRPAAGSIVEAYLRSRGCWIDTPTIRFLPATYRAAGTFPGPTQWRHPILACCTYSDLP